MISLIRLNALQYKCLTIMRYKKLILCIVLLLCVGLFGLYAQEAVPATGGDASGHGGSASYTVGQVVYTTIGPIGSAVQGIQISYEIYELPGSKDVVGITLECSIYPNPVPDYLKLQVKNFIDENLTYSLYDMNGKIITTQKVLSQETIISMIYLSHGVYLLTVTDNKKTIKTFKVIKN